MKLEDSIQYIKGIGPKKAAELNRLGIRNIYDLLIWFPRTYEDQSVLTPIASLQAGETAVVAGTILNLSEHRGGRRNMHILTAMIGDGTGFLQVTWFNQPYLKQQLKPGKRVFLSGKPSYAYGGRGQFAMNQIQSCHVLDEAEEPADSCGIQPVYSTTGHLNQKFFRKVMSGLLQMAIPLPNLLSEPMRKRLGLMERSKAFRAVHFPETMEELRAARRCLAFDELYLIQCGLILLRQQTQREKKGIRHLMNGRLVRQIIDTLPFQLTRDQQKAWRDVQQDMEQERPMRRLIQGDVGSGKTVIAMLALAKTVENGCQGALMAPTEILASQHYELLAARLAPLGMRVGLLSGRLTSKKREEVYRAITRHDLDIVVGTHALIQDAVQFSRLGLVVTDEQHRFGIHQRAELEKRGSRMPDVLVMTATPIPRTMTLTVYGDLDVSLIRELPPGRKPVRTFLRRPDRRALIYRYVREQIRAGRQAYVVCPRIEQSEASPISSAEEVYEELRCGIFQGIPCGLLHGRMKAAEKEAVMRDFYQNRIKLLVSTTVIEVGVNVPNASIMVVEQAERFGLAQLHQLRGRIGRGPYASYCILISEMKTEASQARLHIMESTADGFELAEEDLKLRGPGQFFGSMQHGLPDLRIADVLNDLDILLQARQAAMENIQNQQLGTAREMLRMQYGRQFFHITES